DDAVTQTQQKSKSLAQDAAQAQQANAATRGKLDATDAKLASTQEHLTTMSAQNTEALGQAQGLASAPEQQAQQASAVDDRGAAPEAAGAQGGAAQGAEGQGEEGALLPAQGNEAAAAAPPPAEREKVDLAGGASKALPSSLTGVESPTEKQREEAAAAAEEKR